MTYSLQDENLPEKNSKTSLLKPATYFGGPYRTGLSDAKAAKNPTKNYTKVKESTEMIDLLVTGQGQNVSLLFLKLTLWSPALYLSNDTVLKP